MLLIGVFKNRKTTHKTEVRVKKLLTIVSLFILSFSLFAQGLEFGKTSFPFGDLGGGMQSIERISVRNTSQESIEVTGFECIIQTDGLLPHKMVSSIKLYDGSTELTSLQIPKNGMQSVFLSGGRLDVKTSFVISPQTEKEISVQGEIHGIGLIKIVFTKMFGIGKSKTFYFTSTDEKKFPWRKTEAKELIKMSATTIDRIVAPGSKRFRIPFEINSENQYRSLDLNMIHHRDQRGFTKLVFHEGFSFDYWDDRFSSWSGDLKMNSGIDGSRFIIFGQNYISGKITFNLYAGIANELKEGDIVPIIFGPAMYNDSEVIRCTESNIILGPAVIFGDANNNGAYEITPGDVTATLDLIYEIVPNDDQFLKKKLAADVNGSGEPEDDDLYHIFRMVFDPNYIPPILWEPQIPVIVGKTTSTEQAEFITKRNGSKTEYYLSGKNITSASIKIPIGIQIERGSALNDIFRIGEKSGKQLLVFANKKAIDISKPIFSIQNNEKNIEISGNISGGIPIGIKKITDVHNEVKLPKDFSLSQNYPNPFNPTTTITFTVPTSTHVQLSVFDMLGREVVVLINEEKTTGEYSVKFDASTYASGMYLYKLKTGNNIITKKMLLLK